MYKFIRASAVPLGCFALGAGAAIIAGARRCDHRHDAEELADLIDERIAARIAAAEGRVQGQLGIMTRGQVRHSEHLLTLVQQQGDQLAPRRLARGG